MAFIYPSLHEGFGLLLGSHELWNACFIVECIVPSTEVGGDAALYFDLLSVEAIEEAIEKIIFDVDLRKIMSEKSLIQSKRFSCGQNYSNRRSAKVLGL